MGIVKIDDELHGGNSQGSPVSVVSMCRYCNSLAKRSTALTTCLAPS